MENQQSLKKKGGCGCKAQLGGSLASDSVVRHVDEKAWNLLNRNATANVVSSAVHGGGGDVVAGSMALAGQFKSLITGFLGTPMHVGGLSIDEYVRNNISKRGMKKYARALKKLSAAAAADGEEEVQSGGKIDAFFNGLDALTGLVNMSKVSTYMTGGRDAIDSVDTVFDKLTLHGAEAIAKLLTDTAVLEGGVSIASHLKQAVVDLPSEEAKVHITELSDKLKSKLTSLMINNLNLTNLKKIKLLADAYNTAPLPVSSGGGPGNIVESKYPSYSYMHAAYPTVDSINGRPMPSAATASQNVQMLKYQNLLDPTYSYGFEALANPTMHLLPTDMRNTTVSMQM